jgi:hypothetical protein
MTQKLQSKPVIQPKGFPSASEAASPRVGVGRFDVLGLLWVVGAAGVVMAPALHHGTSLGPYDMQSFYGIAQPAGSAHNVSLGDQLATFIPWTTLSWTQVHHGHLPLWNPYSALGLPLAFNWQSATFSVPALVSYLVPLPLAYTTQVVVTLLIGGTGAYVLARVLGLGVVGSAMAGTVYELCGPFFGWLGWPYTGVMSWAGWLFAAAILIVRGRRRIRSIVFFAVVLACAIYAGHPEILVLLLVSLAVFVAVLLYSSRRTIQPGSTALRPVVEMAGAAVAGIALAAPLLLPGVQLLGESNRSKVPVLSGGISTGTQTFPLHVLTHFLFSSFDGLPLATSQQIGGEGGDYVITAAFVGVVTIVLAVVGVAIRRGPEVIAFAAVVLFTGILAFASPVASALDHLRFAQELHFHYALAVLGFAVAILAGVGTDVLIRSQRRQLVWRWAGGGFVVAALILAILWAFGRGKLDPVESSIRAHSFIWPTVETVFGLAVIAGLIAFDNSPGRHATRRMFTWLTPGRGAAVLLLVAETAFLVSADAPLWSSSSTTLTPTAGEATLARVVGPSIVAAGALSCYYPGIGIQQDVNVAYRVHELAVFDPSIPNALFTAWKAESGRRGGYPQIFCPGVTTATLARRWGVSYVLEPHGAPGPSGGVFERTINDEDLYRIPGASAATLTPLAPGERLPGPDAMGTPVAVSYPGPGSWRMRTDASRAQVLRLRLTDVPGWRATLDGKPLALDTFSGVMLQARVPAGSHTIELHYWPTTFTAGIVLAALGACVLLAASLAGRVRRGRRLARPPSAPGTGKSAT